MKYQSNVKVPVLSLKKIQYSTNEDKKADHNRYTERPQQTSTACADNLYIRLVKSGTSANTGNTRAVKSREGRHNGQ